MNVKLENKRHTACRAGTPTVVNGTNKDVRADWRGRHPGDKELADEEAVNEESEDHESLLCCFCGGGVVEVELLLICI